MKQYDALVFDLDGTLWDAAASSTHGWNLALEELGVPSRVTVDGIRSVSGTPFAQCFEILLPELAPMTDTALERLETHERAAVEAMGGTLFAGVPEGLPELAGRYRLFLVSNCSDWYLAAFLQHSGLRECFTGWDCHGSSGVDKSRMLLDLGTTYGLKDAVYIGDTLGDQKAAEQAGLEFGFVRYGFGAAESPSLSLGSFPELVDLFLDRETVQT